MRNAIHSKCRRPAFRFFRFRRCGLPLLFVLLLSSLSTVGCVPRDIVPKAQLVEPVTLDGGRVLAPSPGASWPVQRWWEVYGDPQLNRLVDMAVAGSPTLRIAQARVRMAAGLAQSAGAGRFPHLGAGGQTIYTHFTEEGYKPAALAGNDAWDNNALVSASYTLDIWGKERASYAAGLDALAAATAEAELARQVLETGVARTYIRLSAQYALLDTGRKTLRQREGTLEITRKLLKAGIGTELAVDQAAAPIPASRSRIAAIEGDIAVSKQELAALCGQGPGAGESISRPALKLARVPGLPASLPAELTGRRPDIVAKRMRVEAASERITVAKAAFYPNINLTAAAGFVGFGFTNFLTGTAATSFIGPAVTLPIFQGGRLRGDLSAGTAAYDEAVETYNLAVINAFTAVAGQVTRLRSLEVQAAEAAKALRLARKAYGSAENGYAAGLTDYLNVLAVENLLLEAEDRDVTIAALRLEAYAQLMYELGGGYEPPAGGAASAAPLSSAAPVAEPRP